MSFVLANHSHLKVGSLLGLELSSFPLSPPGVEWPWGRLGLRGPEKVVPRLVQCVACSLLTAVYPTLFFVWCGSLGPNWDV